MHKQYSRRIFRESGVPGIPICVFPFTQNVVVRLSTGRTLPIVFSKSVEQEE